MHRSEPRKPRPGAERDAAQPIAGQPREDSDSDELEQPEEKPSFLTARELQARAPAKAKEPEEPAATPAEKRSED